MDTIQINDVIWRPSPEVVAASRLQRFLLRHGVPSYAELVDRAAKDPDWFWDAAVKDVGVKFRQPYQRVVDLSRGPEWARFWPGATMNIVDTCIDQHLEAGRGDRPALVFEGEPGDRSSVTYRELALQVSQLAGALAKLGIRKGDRVGIFVPMGIEAAEALLACAKIGAVSIPLFSGFGAEAIASRLRDGGAKVLICADGSYRRGRVQAMKEVADLAVKSCPTVKHLLMTRRVGREVPWSHERDRLWGVLTEHEDGELPNLELEADHPLMILYTSGTTGSPKGAVHVHGGFPVKAAQDLAHAFDMGADDAIFWYSDLGWMMGPWLIFGALALGGTAVLYEGAPDHPGPDRLWQVCSELGVNILGVSPTLVRGLMAHGPEPCHAHDLSRLRVLGGTGEPWNPEPFQWFFEHVGGSRLPIINYTGGTEVSGGILSGNVLTPIRPCSFAGPLPGIGAAVLDESGRPVKEEVGELCITSPWPGMTNGFWGNSARYLETYWRRFPGVWVHGDWAYVAEDGLWYVLGRSDDTIKLAGKRLGPAEVESVLVADPDVMEAAAIGVPDPLKGEALVCFAVLKPGARPGLDKGERLRAKVGRALGRALRPEAVHFVPDLPKTRNAKILRRLVRAAYLGLELGDVTSLENPASLEPLRSLSSDSQ